MAEPGQHPGFMPGFEVCTLCGVLVFAGVLDLHTRWHKDEVNRVAEAQRKIAMRSRFPMRPA